MSFAVSRTAVAAGGARATPRASPKARVSCALATRAPSGAFFRATHLRGSHTAALRAAPAVTAAIIAFIGARLYK